jgi:hypothetical protein
MREHLFKDNSLHFSQQLTKAETEIGSPCCEKCRLAAVPDFSSWIAAPDFISGDRLGHDGSRGDYCAVPDVDALENDRIDADNNVPANVDRSYFRRLISHSGFNDSSPVMVICQNTSRADSGVIADLDAAMNVKFHAAPNKNAIANADAGPRMPVSVEFEIDIGFEYAVASDLKLVRPGNDAFWDRGPWTNFCAKEL